jgi:hypothetical protein
MVVFPPFFGAWYEVSTETIVQTHRTKSILRTPFIMPPTAPAAGGIATDPGAALYHYDVLFYLRKRKVHTTKGVSKMDGQLIVAAPPLSTVKLVSQAVDSDENDSNAETQDQSRRPAFQAKRFGAAAPKIQPSVVTHFSSVLPEIAAQAAATTGGLEEDQVLSLGPYHVQITSIRNAAIDGVSKVPTGTAMIKRTSIVRRPPLGQLHAPVLRREEQTVCEGRTNVVPASCAKPMTDPGETDSTTTTAAFTSVRRPLVSKKIKTNSLLSRSHIAPKGTLGIRSTSGANNPTSATLPRLQPLTSRTVMSKPMASHHAPVDSAGESTSTAILPHIPLPANLRLVLRPHQVVGIDFVWASLQKNRGCILADEMGLGKSVSDPKARLENAH